MTPPLSSQISGGGEHRSYFRVLSALLTIRDGVQKARIEYALPEVHECLPLAAWRCVFPLNLSTCRGSLLQLAGVIKKVLVRRGLGDERFIFFAVKYLLMLGFREPVRLACCVRVACCWSVLHCGACVHFHRSSTIGWSSTRTGTAGSRTTAARTRRSKATAIDRSMRLERWVCRVHVVRHNGDMLQLNSSRNFCCCSNDHRYRYNTRNRSALSAIPIGSSSKLTLNAALQKRSRHQENAPKLGGWVRKRK